MIYNDLPLLLRRFEGAKVQKNLLKTDYYYSSPVFFKNLITMVDGQWLATAKSEYFAHWVKRAIGHEL